MLTGDGGVASYCTHRHHVATFLSRLSVSQSDPPAPLLPSADPHSSSSSLGVLGVGNLWTVGLVRLFLDLLRRMEEQEILPHPICGSGGAEWCSGDRGSFHLPSGDPSGAAVEKREHRPEQPSPRATALPARLFVIRAALEARHIMHTGHDDQLNGKSRHTFLHFLIYMMWQKKREKKQKADCFDSHRPSTVITILCHK